MFSYFTVSKTGLGCSQGDKHLENIVR